MILETDSKTFNKNINIIKKSEKFIGGNKNKKDLIIQIFQDLLDYHKTLNDSKESEFRINSYEKIISELKKLNKITSLNNIKNINSLGKKSMDKIKIIIEKNKLQQHENIKKFK